MIEQPGITIATDKGHLPPVLRSTFITTQEKRGLPYGTPIKILYHDATDWELTRFMRSLSWPPITQVCVQEIYDSNSRTTDRNKSVK